MSGKYPFVTAICPTFRHPDLLANSLELWLNQDYPIDRRHLLILDDAPTFSPQSGSCWSIMTHATRFPSLPDKYNHLLKMMPRATEIVLVWEDDDIYLDSYVSTHVKALETAELSKPSHVFTDCGAGGAIQFELVRGRCHSSTGFKKSLIDRVGGWIKTRRADFDLQFISMLFRQANGINEWESIEMKNGKVPYVYCWNTGAAHCQWTMKSPDDEAWYDRADESYGDRRYIGKLVPKLNQKTIDTLKYLQ